MVRRHANNSCSRNIGFVDDVLALDLRQLKRDGLIRDGERKFYQQEQIVGGLVEADLRHDEGVFNVLVINRQGVRQIIPLQRRPTGFGGYRWYMLDTSGQQSEIFYLCGRYYASRQEIGLKYVSQSEPLWARRCRTMRELEAELEGLVPEGRVALKRRDRLEDQRWQARVAFERTIDGDGAVLVERVLTRHQAESRRQRSSQRRLKLFERAIHFRSDLMSSNAIISQYEPRLHQLKLSSPCRRFAICAGAPKTRKMDPIAEVDLRCLCRLGLCDPGKLSGFELGWPPGWLQREGRRLFVLVDRRLKGHDCTLFVTHDPSWGPITQFFWLREGEGAFGKSQMFFCDPHRDHASDRLRFSHRGFRHYDDGVPAGDKWDFVRAEHEARRLLPSSEQAGPDCDCDIKVRP